MSKIYNKNAREKALLEEAYTGVYKESAVDVELDHWWDFDIDDVIRFVYHGAKRQLPPEDPAEYEEASEKVVTWLKGKYPQPDEYHPGYGKVEDGEEHEMEFDERGFAKNTKAGKEDEDAESREERADVDKYEYEQGKEAGEREDNIEYAKRLGDHAKGVKMAIEALGMLKDELHIDGHSEDINVNELADAHDQLSRALHWILDETDVEYIIGGRADRAAERDLDFKPADGREY